MILDSLRNCITNCKMRIVAWGLDRAAKAHESLGDLRRAETLRELALINRKLSFDDFSDLDQIKRILDKASRTL